jgi:hypothetical protein
VCLLLRKTKLRCAVSNAKFGRNECASTSVPHASITKGRDFAFNGAIDGLRIDDTVYDFEETGVFTTTP